LQILGAQFRFEVLSRVPLELGNPNAFPLDHVTARVIDLEGEEVRAPDLGPKETVKIDIPVRFRKAQSAGRTRSIIIRLRYECQGRSYGPQDYTFQVTMKALQEATDDDTDL
jgi:hypothetical protein